jgi:hypothetical protein
MEHPKSIPRGREGGRGGRGGGCAEVAERGGRAPLSLASSLLQQAMCLGSYFIGIRFQNAMYLPLLISA